MSSYMVREDGKNGTVEILDDRIIRTRKKRLGKDDTQTIPLKAISAVSHDRKTLGPMRSISPSVHSRTSGK